MKREKERERLAPPGLTPNIGNRRREKGTLQSNPDSLSSVRQSQGPFLLILFLLASSVFQRGSSVSLYPLKSAHQNLSKPFVNIFASAASNTSSNASLVNITITTSYRAISFLHFYTFPPFATLRYPRRHLLHLLASKRSVSP